MSIMYELGIHDLALVKTQRRDAMEDRQNRKDSLEQEIAVRLREKAQLRIDIGTFLRV